MDSASLTESAKAFIDRRGVLSINKDGRVTSDLLKTSVLKSMWRSSKKAEHIRKTQVDNGYVYRIGNTKIKGLSLREAKSILMRARPGEQVVVVYPIRFCRNCVGPAWDMLSYEHEGHMTCKRCGGVNRCPNENLGTLNLDHAGKASKSKWNIAPVPNPGSAEPEKCKHMTQRMIWAHQKIHKTRKGMGDIMELIDDITKIWTFPAMESIIEHAKEKLRQYDGGYPRGKGNTAAACVHAAVKDYEDRMGEKTVCTLGAITMETKKSVKHKVNVLCAYDKMFTTE